MAAVCAAKGQGGGGKSGRDEVLEPFEASVIYYNICMCVCIYIYIYIYIHIYIYTYIYIDIYIL